MDEEGRRKKKEAKLTRMEMERNGKWDVDNALLYGWLDRWEYLSNDR